MCGAIKASARMYHMKFFETLLNWVTHHYHLRGKNTLIKLLRKIAPGELFVRSVYGVYLKEAFEDATWRACCYGYRDSVVPDFIKDIPENGCFIDIGANVGVFSLLAARQMSADGVVVSFEVNPITYYKLVRNIERNQPACLMLPLNIGLSSTTEIMQVSFDESHSGTSHIVSAPGSRGVITSDWSDIQFIEKIINDRDTYIKIDVEGLEFKVLKAAASFLRNNFLRKIVVEIDDVNMARYDSTPEQIYSLLSETGFVPTVNTQAGPIKGHYDEIFIKNQV